MQEENSKMGRTNLLKCRILSVAILAFLLVPGCSRPPANKEEAQTKINRLMDDYRRHADRGKFQAGLEELDEILALCDKFSCDTMFRMDIMDRKHFALLSMGKHAESLEVALALEEIARQSPDRGKPWFCLKISDSYLGMGKYDHALDWIGRAVREKGFTGYKLFMKPQYRELHKNPGFQALLRLMKDKIGLDQPARDFTVRLTDGSDFSLSSRKGKVVLVDFWNVRCAPCVKAFPELKALYAQHHERGLEIVGISLDTEKELLHDFLKKNDIPWPIACSCRGWRDELVSLYHVDATPSTWLIDRHGVLRFNDVRGDELKTAIEELLQNGQAPR